jgi:hypothetical protein
MKQHPKAQRDCWVATTPDRRRTERAAEVEFFFLILSSQSCGTSRAADEGRNSGRWLVILCRAPGDEWPTLGWERVV